MTKITIFGAGVTGLCIASRLSRDYDITVVARDLPGDEPSQQWSSPWACAGWVALGGTPLEQKMQLDSLAYFTKLASSHPESSVRISELTDLHDVGATTAEELWSKDRVPGFQKLEVAELPESMKTGVAVRYPSFVLTPSVFLPWLRRRLETCGVKFQRISTVQSLDELKDLGHDILVNASGVASRTLTDVLDDKVITDRTYTTLVRSDYDKSFVRRTATEYTYIFGRGDGTTVLGGISEPMHNEPMSKAASRADLVKRANANLPDVFTSSNPEDYTILADYEGIRPLRLPEVRVEKEATSSGQKVVHAYGTTIGGYMHGFGLGREAARLVDEYIYDEK